MSQLNESDGQLSASEVIAPGTVGNAIKSLSILEPLIPRRHPAWRTRLLCLRSMDIKLSAQALMLGKNLLSVPALRHAMINLQRNRFSFVLPNHAIGSQSSI